MALTMAIIGMGGMAGWHYENLARRIPEITVAAGYDILPETRQQRAKEWGIRAYETPDELYADKQIDIVLIVTPNDSHMEYAINCLNSGKHVICEKPVTLSSSDLAAIIDAAQKTGKFFSVHQNRRWDKDYVIIKKILADGLLHKPFNITSRVQGSKRLWGWRAFKQNGGGILLDWGVHLLDQMLDLIPRKIVSVHGALHSLQNSEVDDCFTGMLRFEGGCAGIVDISTNCFIVEPRWHMSCEDGTAVVDDWECGGRIIKQADPNEIDWTQTLVYTAAGPTKTMLPRPKETTVAIALPDAGDCHWTDYYKNVVQVLRGKADPIVTAAQTMRVLRVIEAIFECNRTGRTDFTEV